MGLFPEILPHHRQTLQRKVLLHEIGGEEEDEHRVDEAGNDSGGVLYLSFRPILNFQFRDMSDMLYIFGDHHEIVCQRSNANEQVEVFYHHSCNS